jgi:phage terminase large subunit-like protein
MDRPLTLDEKEELRELRRLQLHQMEKKIELQEGLPFLHGWKWYPWARQFFESKNKINLLCAANQISKSSTQIRKCIDWATNVAKWDDLWPRASNLRTKQFWYLYPSSKQVRAEFETKWPEFLPSGKYKTEKEIDGKPNYYAWKDIWIGRDLYAIHFFVSNVFIYFKTYSQDVENLQTGTVDALFCDEELPEELYEELIFRISASKGYFHMVFTATLGQDFWRRAMEPEEGEVEVLPEAAKWTVSMYDCLTYEDHSPSHWTPEAIQEVIDRCSSQAEVLKRVFGKFISLSGRKYEQFDLKRHMVKDFPDLPPGWLVFAGVDPGSGGKENHPAAVCFVAVTPDLRQGRVVEGWRGDGIETSSGDVFMKFLELRDRRGFRLIRQFYDWADKDFDIISTRNGCPFEAADKSHTKGEQILNTLFKNDMLTIDSTPELQKLGSELASLRRDTAKNKAKDDFSDALRYAVTQIPWDFTAIRGPVPAAKKAAALTPEQQQIQERREHVSHAQREEDRLEAEFAEYNDLAGT